MSQARKYDTVRVVMEKYIQVRIVKGSLNTYSRRVTTTSAWIRKRLYDIFAVNVKNVLSSRFQIERVKGKEIIMIAIILVIKGKWYGPSGISPIILCSNVPDIDNYT